MDGGTQPDNSINIKQTKNNQTMAELPTPRSIAVGTLISLYSDPNSPLQSNRHPPPHPPSAAEWSLRLMDFIQQLVMREDEGVVVLPNRDFGLWDGGGDDPAEDAGDGDDDRLGNYGCRNSARLENTAGNGDVLKKDTFFSEGQDILEDVLGLFGSSLPSDDPEMMPGAINEKPRPNGNRIRGGAGIDGGCVNFMMEPLSALLDRIDDAYFASFYHPADSNRRPKRSARKRTPPSLALLSRLQIASSSVDDLMNVLDEWHALLEGVHVGYPPPLDAPNGQAVAGPSTIAVDGDSTFGVYLRRLCLGMEEIPFESLSRLWDALREFVREEIALQAEEQKRRTLGCCEENGTTKNIIEDHAKGEEWLSSLPQIERIVRRTCLEHNLGSSLLHGNNEGGPLSPLSSNSSSTHPHYNQQHLHNLLETHPECPSLHFLLYLSSFANGHRCQAFESLHRYFDYAMIHERKERAERAIMMQTSGGEGGTGNLTTNSGIAGGSMTTVATSMGGITGGMNGTFAVGNATMPGMGGAQQRGGVGGAGGGGGVVLRESNVMQYAAVLLAQTYHRFGHARLALQATEEAVRVAQQSGDEECVCFANGWMALVSASLGSGGGVGVGGVHAGVGGLSVRSVRRDRGYRPLAAGAGPLSGSSTLTSREEEAMLQRCRVGATERGLTSLAAGASLELARRLAYRRHEAGDDSMGEYDGGLGSNQETAGLPSSLAAIHSAGRMPSSMAGSSSTAGRGQTVSSASASSGMLVAQAPTDIYNLSNTDAMGILGRQNKAITGLWESTGHFSLASLSSCAALYGTGGSNSGGGDDMTPSSAAMMTRVLSSFTNGPGSDVWFRENSREGRVEGLEHRQGGRGESQQEAFGKVYGMIIEKLVSLSETKLASPSEGKQQLSLHHHISSPNNHRNISEWIFSAAAASILHEWSVRSYDLSIARGLHTLLANHASFPSSNGGGTGSSTVEASLRLLSHSTHLCIQREEYDRAKVAARHACWLASRHSLTFHKGWHLLQLALIDVESSSTLPHSSVERALPPLLDCLELCDRYSMDPLRALALATLAKVLLCMGRYSKARALLRGALPLVMQNSHIWFQGEALLTSAKCHLAEARSGKVEIGGSADERKTVDLLETTVLELKQSAFHFKQIEDVRRLRQVYYLLALVSHSLPPTSARKEERDIASRMFMRLSISRRMRMCRGRVFANAGGRRILS